MEIQTDMVKGVMAKRALSMLFEWIDLHRMELMENWSLAKDRKPLQKIMPLP